MGFMGVLGWVCEVGLGNWVEGLVESVVRWGWWG